MNRTRQHAAIVFAISLGVLLPAQTSQGQDSSAERRLQAMQFHLRAQERTGLLIPLYVYPANIHTNPVYNRLIELKRRHETVPFWVIMNPASGPGEQVDANYTKAIDRLIGAGCVVIGYVSTRYGKRPREEVAADVQRWRQLYPRTQGLFFDEMVYENSDAGVAHQAALRRLAQDEGFWPTVANPGTDTPERYFVQQAADVFVVHEGSDWPSEARLHGDYFGGYSDYPPFTRCVLLHSLAEIDSDKLAMLRRHARWIYITDDPYKPGQPGQENPWDTLSVHMERLCEELSR